MYHHVHRSTTGRIANSAENVITGRVMTYRLTQVTCLDKSSLKKHKRQFNRTKKQRILKIVNRARIKSDAIADIDQSRKNPQENSNSLWCVASLIERVAVQMEYHTSLCIMNIIHSSFEESFSIYAHKRRVLTLRTKEQMGEVHSFFIWLSSFPAAIKLAFQTMVNSHRNIHSVYKAERTVRNRGLFVEKSNSDEKRV